MQILSIALKNFKCHDDRYFEFQPGFNAISGENGVGKSSILEAIAWVLFDHTDYTKDELTRRGAKTAQVAVQFISRADGRTYRVERSTNTGYRIIDPQINKTLEVTRVNEEVIPWLKEHLGVSAGADLTRLFADMIGIPQGTFTADFLKRPKDRKEVFNPLLKVEDYDRAATQSLALENLAKAAAQEVAQTIAHYDDRLRDWDNLKQQQQQLQQTITQDQVALAEATTNLEALTQEKAALVAIVAEVQQLEQTVQQLNTQLGAQQQTIALRQQTLSTAQAAVEICAANQETYQAYLAAEEALVALNRDAQTRQTLLNQRQAEQTRLEAGKQEMIRLEVQLEALHQAATDLEQLAPLIDQQAELERSYTELTNQLQQLAVCRQEQTTLTRQQRQVQTRLSQLQQAINRLQALATEVNTIPDLEQQRDRLQHQISHIAAARQFQTELDQLVQQSRQERDRYQPDLETTLTALHDLQASLPLYREPIAQAIGALQTGSALTNTLIASLEQILADLTQQVSEPALRQQLQSLNQRLTVAYQQRAELATLADQQVQLTDAETESQKLQTRLTDLATQLATEPALKQQQTALQADLTALDNPRGRSQLLGKRLQQQEQLHTSYTQIQQEQALIQTRYDRLTEQLQPFAELDTAIANQNDRRQTSQLGYTRYIQHQQQAAQVPEAEQALQAATTQLAALQRQQAIAQQAWQQRSQDYDRQRLPILEAAIAATLATQNQLTGRLPLNQEHLTLVEQQLAERTALAEERDRAQQTLATRQQTAQFITTVRSVYRQAGPRITRFYLGEISREADRLFRELMNRQNLALEWTEDYDIRIQESGYWRSFKALSGGEQMCAALAVRLALLKVLADIDIAFFDEPTTNMDRQRRQQLAEALTNLKAFRQVFVISHDDTFENLTENVVRVDRR